MTPFCDDVADQYRRDPAAFLATYGNNLTFVGAVQSHVAALDGYVVSTGDIGADLGLGVGYYAKRKDLDTRS